MIFLLDTHLLLWASYEPSRLSEEAAALIEDQQHEPLFSPASIWEVAIKSSLGRDDFDIDARVLRRSLLEVGYQELPITGAHAAEVSDLPHHHRDPFDRLLVAQARVEGVTLLTSDRMVSSYGTPARLI